jgi:thymidylate synthase
MKQYHDALRKVLDTGTTTLDRTGVGTIRTFGLQMIYDLSEGFPAITTKKLAWKSVVSELLWFIEGSGDESRLKEILYEDRNSDKNTIWSANANSPYWKNKSKFKGDLGRIYGVQWRHWRKHTPRVIGTYKDDFGNVYRRTSTTQISEIDQLKNLIVGLKTEPYGRRHILTAWNVGELDQMALPPCHCFAQFFVEPSNDEMKLSCQMYQRSADMFLGVPFNIASYSLFTHLIAQICDMKVGKFIHVLGDAHIYLNHVDQVKEQLSREYYSLPTLRLNPDIKDIDKFKMSDIELLNYRCHSAITASMAV